MRTFSFPLTPGLLLCLLIAASAHAQRHLPSVQIFSSPVPIIVDAQIEHPATHSNVRAAALPDVGEVAEFQLFVPSAAGREIFEYTLEFDDPDSVFTRSFRVVAAADWQGKDLDVFSGAENTIRTSLRFRLAVLPPTGHVLTVGIAPKHRNPDRAPVRFRLTVTTVTNRDRRVWQMETRGALHWR